MQNRSTPTVSHVEEAAFLNPLTIGHGLANLMCVLENAIVAGDQSNALRAKDGLVEFIKNGYVARDAVKESNAAPAPDVAIRFPDPKNKTEGLANFVAMAQIALRDEQYDSAMYILTDLANDIGSIYVCDEEAQAVLGDIIKLDNMPGDRSEATASIDARAQAIYRVLPSPAVLPEFDPETDGNYSSWLAANNID